SSSDSRSRLGSSVCPLCPCSCSPRTHGPESLPRGLVIKIIFVVALFRAILAALAFRAHAQKPKVGEALLGCLGNGSSRRTVSPGGRRCSWSRGWVSRPPVSAAAGFICRNHGIVAGAVSPIVVGVSLWIFGRERPFTATTREEGLEVES